MTNHSTVSMKRLSPITKSAGFIFLLFLYGCNAFEVTEDVTYEVEYSVNSPAKDFYEVQTINPYEESDDFEAMEDKLETAEIIKIEYTVVYFNGPDDQNLTLAEVHIADSTGNNPQLLCRIQDVNLKSSMHQFTEVTADYAGLNRFKDIVEHSDCITQISMSIHSNMAPMDFKVKFYVTIRATGHII